MAVKKPTTTDTVTNNDPAVPTAHVPAETSDVDVKSASATSTRGTKVTAESSVIDRLKRSNLWK
jgi:hypothetical protein